MTVPRALICAGAVILSLFPQPSGPQAKGQSQTIVIRAGTLLDGRGGQRRNVDIVVDGARIVRIEPASSARPTYDLSALTVMPGGIDTHVHINWHFDPDGKTHHLPGSEESREQQLRYTLDNAAVTLRSGITTVQSLGADIDRDAREQIHSGKAPGPRLITSLGSLSERTGTPDQ